MEKYAFLLILQIRRTYYFINQRIAFRGGFAKEVDIQYLDIESISKCCVGGLIRVIPTGIKVIMKEGKKYYLSVLKRKEIMEFIQSKIS